MKTKRVVKIFNILALFIAFLSLYGFGVAYVVNGGSKLGIFTEPIKNFISFPRTVINVLKSDELKGIPKTFKKKDTLFKQINNLNYDLYGLNSFYSTNQDRWEIKLFNFKNDSLIHQWNLEEENYDRGNYDYGDKERQFNNAVPRNSILLTDRSLIAMLDLTRNLYRLDKNSNIVWHNKGELFHHSMNLDADGDIWTSSSDVRNYVGNENESVYYRDDFITKISVETGKIIFNKSVSDILIENGYKNFVYGFSNVQELSDETDPIHLNDIQPALNDTHYWKKGDLFLSLRNRSVVLLYRPMTNKIIHFLSGPFLNQHDVDIISDTEISIFNNNVTNVGTTDIEFIKFFEIPETSKDYFKTSEIIIYNFQDSTFRTHLNDHFIKEKISTTNEGFHEILKSGDVYVESQNDGKVYIMNKDEILLKKQFNASIKNMVERPHWIRIYENINF